MVHIKNIFYRCVQTVKSSEFDMWCSENFFSNSYIERKVQENGNVS